MLWHSPDHPTMARMAHVGPSVSTCYNSASNCLGAWNTQLPPEAPRREQVPLQAGATPCTATRCTPLHITTSTLDINKISGLNIASIWLKNTKYHHLCSFSWISESLQVSPSLKAFCHSTSLDSQLGLAVWQLKIRRSIHKASQQLEALPQRPHLHKSKTTLKNH